MEGKRIGLFGASGSGKTTKGRKIIAGLNRLVVFDPKREWEREGKKWLSGFVPVYSYADFCRVLRKKWANKRGFHIVYVPPFGAESDHLSAICATLYAWQAGYKKTHTAKITLFIDEAQEGIPAGTGRNNPQHGALILARMGRDRGVNMVVASQRITTVDIGIRANLSDYYIFRLAELTDIKAAAEIVRDKQKLLEMENYSYFYKAENGKINFFNGN